MIAALFVESGGCYFGLDGVDPWDEARDARNYPGPHPVVAHPPCARWSRFAGFVESVHPGRFPKGEDEGRFASALAAVRKWGGVLEHPEASSAWKRFELNLPPRCGGWVVADWQGGWTCCVEQGHYGHRAHKPTWLYACHVDPPTLRWGPSPSRGSIVESMSKRQREETPTEFRDLLIGIAKASRSIGAMIEGNMR